MANRKRRPPSNQNADQSAESSAQGRIQRRAPDVSDQHGAQQPQIFQPSQAPIPQTSSPRSPQNPRQQRARLRRFIRMDVLLQRQDRTPSPQNSPSQGRSRRQPPNPPDQQRHPIVQPSQTLRARRNASIQSPRTPIEPPTQQQQQPTPTPTPTQQQQPTPTQQQPPPQPPPQQQLFAPEDLQIPPHSSHQQQTALSPRFEDLYPEAQQIYFSTLREAAVGGHPTMAQLSMAASSPEHPFSETDFPCFTGFPTSSTTPGPPLSPLSDFSDFHVDLPDFFNDSPSNSTPSTALSQAQSATQIGSSHIQTPNPPLSGGATPSSVGDASCSGVSSSTASSDFAESRSVPQPSDQEKKC